MDPDDSELGDLEPALGDLLNALEELLAQLPAFEEMEFAGALNDAMQELDPEELDLWTSMREVLRALPADLFAQLLDAVGRDAELHAALLELDEDGAPETLAALASDPSHLVTRFQAATSLTPKRP